MEAFFDVKGFCDSSALQGIQGHIALLQTNRTIFGRVTAQGQTFFRDNKKIASDSLDHFIVQVFLKGGGPVQNGPTVQNGDLFVIDMARLHERVSYPFTNLSFIIPRDRDPSLSHILERLHNKTLPGKHPLVAMIRRQMTQLWDYQDNFTIAQMELAMENTVDLIKATLNQSNPASCEATYNASPALGHAIRDYIEQNLGRALEVEHLAARFQISRAQLYRMFTQHSGISRYVQERRLMMAYRMLLQKGNSLSIFSIAASCGFKSESHFSNSFRTRFGRTAQEVRAEGDVLKLRTDGDRDLLDQWLSDL